MVLHRATGEITHHIFHELPSFLQSQDCLVLNKTKVLPAKFHAQRATGGRVEGLFLRELTDGRWHVLLKNAQRLKVHERLGLDGSSGSMAIERRLERGIIEVSIDPADSASRILNVIGSAPLPPYIRRKDDQSQCLHPMDLQDYQTVYAAIPGAVAAPTAGMHFTRGLLQKLLADGISTAEVILHVGLGTFRPVEVDHLADHPMHAEWYDLPQQSVETIRQSRLAQGRIIAVGTTSVRVLETCWCNGELQTHNGWTDLLIYPPYSFGVTDALLTNFHLPGSTLLALICAFADRDLILKKAYPLAIREKYRFYSYGDAMLIL